MFDIVKQQVSLLEVLEKDLGVTFRQMGDKNWVIDGAKDVEACPFCSHHDCFRVHFEEGNNSSSFYKCFSCGEYGDVVTWTAKRFNLSAGKAARQLATERGISVGKDHNPVQEVFNLAAIYYHQCLISTCNKPYPILNGLTPLRYQLEVRKHKKESIEKFMIGFSDGGLIAYLDSLGIDPEIIQQSGLVNKKGSDFLPSNCFIYPNFVKGKVSHFTFKDPLKRIQYQLPKKFTLNGCQFYGQETFDEADPLFLVEGENDRISVMEAGATSCLATIGQLSGEQMDWLREKCKTRRIVTLFDPDSAGDAYREKIESLRKHFAGLAHVRPPEDKDIDDHLTSGADFKELVKGNLVQVTVKSKEREKDKPASILPWEEISATSLTPEEALKTALEADGKSGEGQSTSTTEEVLKDDSMTVVGPSMPPEKYVPPSELATTDEDDEDTYGKVVALENCSVIQLKNCYYKVVYKDGEEERIRISDFTLELLNVYEDESKERYREVIVRRQDGKKSEPFLIDSESKVTTKLFKVLIAKAADCEWLGSQSDLDGMWRLVYNQFPDITIKVTRQVGRNQKHNCWVFKNMLITESGAVVEPDENDIFWMTRNKSGLKVEDLNGEETTALPVMKHELSREDTEKLLAEYLRRMSLRLKSIGSALISVGWIHSNIYSDEIFKAQGGMGLLMFWGLAGRGKSTVVRWLQSFFGMTNKMATMSVQQLGTAVGFKRKGEYYSSMPIFLDELRADELSSNYLGMIRSWYDREGRTLAKREGFGIKDQKIRSTLIIAGEDLPADPATRERCIMIRIPSIATEAPEMVDNFNIMEERLSPMMSNMMYYWILDSCKVDKKSVLAGIRELDEQLIAAGCSNRISKVWSSAAYFAKQLADKFFPEYDFMDYLVKSCTEEQKQQKNDNTLSSFMEMMEIVHGRGDVQNPAIGSHNVRAEGDLVHIWFPSVFKEVTDANRERGKWSKNAILRAIREEPYYVSDDKKVTMGISGVRRTVLTLDLTKAPIYIKNIVSYESPEVD